MRTFKFRAWDLDNEYMFYQDKQSDMNEVWEMNEHGISVMSLELIDSYPGGQYHEQKEEWRSLKQILMQYTGLNDVNQKEVYEGDIVKVFDMNRCCDVCEAIETGERSSHEIGEECENYICTQVVKWGDYTGYCCDEDTGEFCPLLGSDEISLEVIGNIYQNKDLLK